MYRSSFLLAIPALVGSAPPASEKYHLNDDGVDITEVFDDAPDVISILTETNEIIDPRSAPDSDSTPQRISVSLPDCGVKSDDSSEVQTTSAEAEITPQQAKAIEIPRIIRLLDDILASDIFQEFILGPLYFVSWWLYLYFSG